MFMDVGHIAYLVLAAHGQRDLVENLPVIVDLHRQAAVITTSILISPNLFRNCSKTALPVHIIAMFKYVEKARRAQTAIIPGCKRGGCKNVILLARRRAVGNA